MKKSKFKFRFFFISFLSMLPLLTLFSCSKEKIYTQLSDFNGCRLGCFSGTGADKAIDNSQKIKDYSWTYYNDVSQMCSDLVDNKIDGFPAELPYAEYIVNNSSRLTTINEFVTTSNYAFVLNKANLNLRASVDRVINEFINDGTIDKLKEKWQGSNESAPKEMTPITGTGSIINYYFYPCGKPMSYIVDNTLYGFDYDLAIKICNKLNYKIVADENNYRDDIAGVVIATNSARNTIGGGCITINDALKEKIAFTNSYMSGGLRIVARAPLNQISVPEQLNEPNKRVAIIQGSIYEDIVKKDIPKANRLVFQSIGDCTQALVSGKIDGFLCDDPKVKYTVKHSQHLTYIKNHNYYSDQYGFIFPKNSSYLNEFNNWFDDFKTTQEYIALHKKWIEGDESIQLPTVDASNLKSNRVLRYSTATAGGEPYNFIQDGKIVGYEAGLINYFCRDKNYELKVLDGSGLSPIMDISQGKADIGGGSISITEERKKQMDFSSPTYAGGTSMMVKDYSSPDNKNFFGKIGDAFYNTFVVEGRWKLFLIGIGNTLLITVASVIIGSILGFVLFLLLKKTNNKVLDKILRGVSWLLTSMPVVVLLMIFYYLVFKSAPISGTVVSIIVFSLLFTCSTLSLLRLGTNAVDKGQEEAATALGYSKMATFFKIILPQALKHIFPPFKSEISSLIKGTAIVGYIAVQDLTKIADIIRSQTYEAFVPLIFVAIIYLLFALLFSLIINKINVNVDPKHRKKDKILKGIDDHD